MRLDNFFLAGFEYVITQLKSVVLSLGIIDRHLSVEQAVLLSRLEEEYQVGGQSIILSAISGVDMFNNASSISRTKHDSEPLKVHFLDVCHLMCLCCPLVCCHLPSQCVMWWKSCLFSSETWIYNTCFLCIHFIFCLMQIRCWGSVEWAHDYDTYELRARTAAGALFVHLTSESSTVKHKLMQDWIRWVQVLMGGKNVFFNEAVSPNNAPMNCDSSYFFCLGVTTPLLAIC